MQRLLIDTDPGVDDAHAILMALAHPDARVEALMAVAGNVGLERTTANACTILDIAEKDVPVYAGCGSALVMEAAEDAALVHGADGLGGANLPPSERPVSGEHASAALIRMANEAPGELSLITIGPVTNVAVALKLDPTLPQKLNKLVVMGGAITSKGNTANLSAEFNIYADPEAAHIVFSSFPEFTLVSWEATMAHGFGYDVLNRWFGLGTPRSDFFKQTNTNVIEFIREEMGREMLFGADALAMAVALEPDIVTKAEKHYVSVELNGRTTRGQTTVDWFDRSGQPPNANIVLEVDYDRFLSLMEAGLV